jgi:hypothetical protein
MDATSAFNKVLTDVILQATSTIVGPTIIITLLVFALISLLLDKVPTNTVISAHLIIFLFASVATYVPVLITFQILVRTLGILLALKYVGRFFAWLGMDEGFFGPRLLILLGLGVTSALTLASAVAELDENTRDKNWKRGADSWNG